MSRAEQDRQDYRAITCSCCLRKLSTLQLRLTMKNASNYRDYIKCVLLHFTRLLLAKFLQSFFFNLTFDNHCLIWLASIWPKNWIMVIGFVRPEINGLLVRNHNLILCKILHLTYQKMWTVMIGSEALVENWLVMLEIGAIFHAIIADSQASTLWLLQFPPSWAYSEFL